MFFLASRKQWIIALGLLVPYHSYWLRIFLTNFQYIRCSSFLITAIVILITNLQTLGYHHEAIDIKSLWGYGLGQVHGVNVAGIFKNRNSSQFILAVGFANSLQLGISALYLLHNALVSTLCVAEEYSHFGKERKFLRVSAPRGMQRSSYFLLLPYRYGIPLSIAIGLLHWCISQAVFLVETTAFLPNGTRNPSADSSRVGFSSIGIVFGIIVGGVLILGLAGVGWFRKLEFDLPIVSTNSAAISAACHCPLEDVDAYLLPVKWGVTEPGKRPDDPGHCCLTTARDIEEVKLGSYYA